MSEEARKAADCDYWILGLNADYWGSVGTKSWPTNPDES